MMVGVSPETCWAPFKIRNNKMLIHCCIFLDFHCKSCINYLLGTIYLYYYCWSKSRTFTRPWIYLAKLIIKIWIVPTTNLLLLSWKIAGYSRNFLRFVGAKVNFRAQNSQPHYSIEIQINPGYILNPHFVKSISIIFSSHTCLPISVFSSSWPKNIDYSFLVSYVLHAQLFTSYFICPPYAVSVFV